MKPINRRRRTVLLLAFSIGALALILVSGMLLEGEARVTDFARKNLSPTPSFPFGTDWMGRDMLTRTLAGLSLSIRIGLLTAAISALVAFAMGAAAAAFGRIADGAVSGLIDVLMGIPHMLLLILISFACGKGLRGIVIGVSCTHWMSLARLIRGEIMQLRQSAYIKVAEKLGVSRVRIVFRHMAPHLLPQFIVGLVLLFPHAILHEAGVSFLGFGLPPEQPTIGIILSESMGYLSAGRWWLALFPGLMLVGTVMLFDRLGSAMRRLLDPASFHE